MAKLVGSAQSENSGERQFIAKAIEYLDDNHIIYWNRQLFGKEFDVCILLPERGILVVELKGWRPETILRVENDAIFIRTDEGEKAEFPQKQARGYRFSLQRHIRSSIGKKPLIFQMVCLPQISRAFFRQHRLDVPLEERFTFLQEDLDSNEAFFSKIDMALVEANHWNRDSFDSRTMLEVRNLFETGIDLSEEESAQAGELQVSNEYDYSRFYYFSPEHEDMNSSIAEAIEEYISGCKLYCVFSFWQQMELFVHAIDDALLRRGLLRNRDKLEISFDPSKGHSPSLSPQATSFSAFHCSFSVLTSPLPELRESFMIAGGCCTQKQKNILQKLSRHSVFNAEQYFIEHAPPLKNIVIRAGAGTGKTYTMISRIAFVCYTQGVPLRQMADRIVMITFTNEAADQMEAKLKDYFRSCYLLTSREDYLDMISFVDHISAFTPPCDWETATIGQTAVTLYPFTSRTIMKLYEKLPVKSPRMFLRQVIRDELKEFFDAQIYDSENYFPINIGFIQMANSAHSSAIDRDESIPPQDKERLKSILAIWGDGSATVTQEQGQEFIGGVNRAFLAQVGLGSYSGIGGIRKPVPVSAPVAGQASPAGSVPAPEQKKKVVDAPTRNYLNWKQDIDDWFSRKQDLKYHADYRTFIRDFLRGSGGTVGAINWQDSGIPAYIASERLSDIGCIYIEGQIETAPREKALLILERTPENRDAILALVERRYAEGWDFENAAYYQQRLITWLERSKSALIRSLTGEMNGQTPMLTEWCMALLGFQALILKSDLYFNDSPQLIRDLLQPVYKKPDLAFSTSEWQDVAEFVQRSKSEFDAARTLLQRSSLTVMGSVQEVKRDKIKQFYRTEELLRALDRLDACHWDLSGQLPANAPGNMLYNPAILLIKLYPRIRKVIEKEKEQFKKTSEGLLSLVGCLDESSLLDALSGIGEMFTEFSASKIRVPEALRLKYDHPPIETAKKIMVIHSRLSAAEGASFIEQLRAYASNDLIELNAFLKDLIEIDRIAQEEQKRADNELKSMTAGSNLDEISELAFTALSELAAMLESMEVQDDAD